MRSNIGCAAAALFLLVLSAACAAQAKQLPSETLRIRTASGAEVPIEAEIAANGADQARGLMHRRRLADGAGMLFVFPSDRRMSFWMKNTYVPLSIAYIASDGRILEIHDMEPLSETAVNSERFARYALEVPRGWFSRAGIGIGDRLELTERIRP